GRATTAARERVGRDTGGVPGPRCAQHSSFAAAPSFRLRPRRCAVVSALRRGLECPFATGCGSAATITVTPAPAAAARRPNVASHLAVTTDDHGAPGVGLSSLLVQVLAQQLLVELAHRGARHLVDDIDFVGHLPLGEALTEGGDDVLPGHLGAVGGHHIAHGALIPLLVGNADDRCFLDARVVEDRVLHVDGRDPLATGLDDVLEPVGDLEIAVLVDYTDVT